MIWRYIFASVREHFHSNTSPLMSSGMVDMHLGDTTVDKYGHSLVSVFCHKFGHRSGGPARGQTQAPLLYHSNTCTGLAAVSDYTLDGILDNARVYSLVECCHHQIYTSVGKHHPSPTSVYTECEILRNNLHNSRLGLSSLLFQYRQDMLMSQTEKNVTVYPGLDSHQSNQLMSKFEKLSPGHCYQYRPHQRSYLPCLFLHLPVDGALWIPGIVGWLTGIALQLLAEL